MSDPNWNKNTACAKNGAATLAAEPLAGCYSYQVTGTDGSPCGTAETPCAHYTLTAWLEGGEKYVKASLN